MGSSELTQDVFPWLKSLPLAPEFRPTLEEFQDPIAYLFKIEKEASKYGICKILPPVPPSSKKTVISNLNRSLAARAAATCRDGGAVDSDRPTFTTRQQQIGFCPRKQRPVQRPVWESGEYYTLQEFEAKAKSFEKNYLKKCGKKGSPSALEIETMYWRATVDKPFSVEYANDMPGSAFNPLSTTATRRRESSDGGTVGDTAWNMRAVSRGEGSLLKYMKEEIPGVTSPMVYIAMMFSWFAWHAEDHDLHSLNYLHMGAGKTWYGVPRDAAVAFEEVVRVLGYGEELNPLVTFATLGKKTTVMSPEVFVKAGIPCCRLVQNPGEFVVTFPRAYHSGFSHGFNCGEASNIATPEWLRVAKEAAIRRAATTYPPMVSHSQLLYDSALALCSRVPASVTTKPRSSRLKDKKRSLGERLTKELFVQNVTQNNKLLHSLGKGSMAVLLPRNSSDILVSSDLRAGSLTRTDQEMCKDAIKPEDMSSNWGLIGFGNYTKIAKGNESVKGKYTSSCETNGIQGTKIDAERDNDDQADGLSDQRLFSCITCGILSFDCVAIIQPREAAARSLIHADSSFFNDPAVGSGQDSRSPPAKSRSQKGDGDHLYKVSVQTGTNTKTIEQKDSDALGLLASTYGDSSDSEEEHDGLDVLHSEGKTNFTNCEVDGSEESSTPLATSCTIGHKRLGEGDTLIVDRDLPFVPRSDEDSSRLHVFCLEHAAEVEQRLRPIGGIHIMLLCHPEYPRLEAEAKIVAEELGVDEKWNKIEFRNITREDEEIIRSALENEKAEAGNSKVDWTVKLGINLCYSAILSRWPLYSKQMPYNSVIYSAFGRSAPAGSSPLRLEFPGRRSARQKKFVVGKWCGKVWMSHQAHPFLVEEELEEEEEPQRSFQPRVASEEGVSVRRQFTVLRNETTMVARKYSRKRKMQTKPNPRKKLTSFKRRECGVSDDTSDDHPYKQQWRASGNEDDCYFETGNTVNGDLSDQMSDQWVKSGLRKETTFHEEEDGEDSNDVSDSKHSNPKSGGCLQHLEDKEMDSNNEVSDRSLEREYAAMDFATSDASMENGFEPNREKQLMLPDDNMYRKQGHIPKSRRSKIYRTVSYDSEENSSYKQRVRVPRSTKKPSRFSDTKEYAYDSAEDNTDDQNCRIVKHRKVKNIEDQEDVGCSDSLVEQGFCNGRKRTAKRRKSKSETRESLKGTKDGVLKSPVSKKKRETVSVVSVKNETNARSLDSYVEGPSTRLRMRNQKPGRGPETKTKKSCKKGSNSYVSRAETGETEEDSEEGSMQYQCDLEGCAMSFGSKQQLSLHKRNICPVKGCGKKFFSHKYLVQHRRVHLDARPLKCPWSGCMMTFKWAWARTEHIRVHTGERPYVCAEPGCGQTFRFVSDFSRHKRKTGHSVKKKAKK